jgi:hypothetical protein
MVVFPFGVYQIEEKAESTGIEAGYVTSERLYTVSKSPEEILETVIV